MFAGLIVHGMFADCITKAPELIRGNANFVKKVVFPLELLPWTTVGAALFHAAISFLVLVVMAPVLGASLHWSGLLLPLVIAPYAILTLGVCWLLASFGVYLRDVGQAMGVLSSVLLFVSPVFYRTSVLPPALQILVSINPLTYVIEQTRGLMFAGAPLSLDRLAFYWIISIAVGWLGFAWFQRSRDGFADVL